MNLVWIGMAAAIILSEKALPHGVLLSRVVGVSLVAIGIAGVIAPDTVGDHVTRACGVAWSRIAWSFDRNGSRRAVRSASPDSPETSKASAMTSRARSNS
jgi:hypothetical protein